jgi:uncharacterized membrane protein YccC
MSEREGTPGGSGQSGQYTGIAVAIGAGLGLTVGALTGGWGIPVGLALGAGVGVVLGAATDAWRKREAH